MNDEIKFASDHSDVESRVFAFRSCMEPALHLFPENIVERLKSDGFFTAPASTKYHGAYEGGLFEHSLNVTISLVELTKQNSLTWGRPESPYIIGMFHDICKQDQYRHPVDATFYGGGAPIPLVDESKWEYDPDAVLKGHGEKSVMLLSQHLSLTMEEILCIRYHMGAFVDQKEWNDYTRAIHAYPNVLWTHTADMLAAHILEVDK
jgi:hypothetical protein